MKVVILAAGYGTRLQSIAANTPKPLLPINGQPLLNYVFDRVESLTDLAEIVVVSNNKFYSVFLQWAATLNCRVPVRVVNDGTNTPEERLGSIGDIEFTIRESKINDDVLVVGGDNLFDFDLDAYYRFANARPQHVTIGVYDIHDIQEATLFGVVALGPNGKIVSFEEKPKQPKSTLVAMCFYYFPKTTLPLFTTYLEQNQKADRAGDYIRWLCEVSDVYGFQFNGKWYDIGSIESYREAQEKFIK